MRVGQHAERSDVVGFASVVWDAVAKCSWEDQEESTLGAIGFGASDCGLEWACCLAPGH